MYTLYRQQAVPLIFSVTIAMQIETTERRHMHGVPIVMHLQPVYVVLQISLRFESLMCK